MRKLFTFVTIVLLILGFAAGIGSAKLYTQSDVGQTYIDWQDENGLSIFKIDDDDGISFVGVPQIGSRYGLTWVAGARGIPSANADLTNATETTRMICDVDFEVLGTGSGAIAVAYYAEGGISLTSDGTDGHGLVLLPHLDTSQTGWSQITWGTDKEVRWDAYIKTSTITTCIIWAGLKETNTPTTATDDDQVFFRYENGVNDGEWQAVNSIADTDDAHDTNVAVVLNTVYHLAINIDSSRIATFFINGVLVETSAALTTEKDLIPYIGIEEDGASSAMVLYIRGQSISRAY
jgi:hypothetical protein